MRVLWRVLVVLAVFVVVGVLAERGVWAHGLAMGRSGPEGRLAAWAGGLFAGGLAAVLATIAVLWKH